MRSSNYVFRTHWSPCILKFHFTRLVLLWFIFAIGCDSGSVDSPVTRPSASKEKPTTGNKKLVIAVVPKATTHEFWKAVHAGAEHGARAAGVQIQWKGPISESDREGQINVVQDFITKRVDGICLAPLDSRALGNVVAEAKAEGIPTLIFDSGLDDDSNMISLVATDNAHGGELAADHMGQLLSGKGTVIVLRYTPGSESTVQRENGFLARLKDAYPDIQVLSESEYAGATAESALDKAQQLLVKYGDQVQGVFTPCEHVSAGMLRALEERELAGRVKFVGFDSSPRLVQALEQDHIHGIVLQDPMGMAAIAVQTMAAHLRGEKVERRISTGEHLATRENMNTPAMQRLLKPEQGNAP